MCQSCYLYHQSLSDCPLSVSLKLSHFWSKILTSKGQILKQVTLKIDATLHSNTSIGHVISSGCNWLSCLQSPCCSLSIFRQITPSLKPSCSVINRFIGSPSDWSTRTLLGFDWLQSFTFVSSVMQSINSNNRSFYPWAVQISAHYQVSRTWQLDNYKVASF